MAKRFIDTELFSDDWFCELSKDTKLFFLYFITSCDHAGVLKHNKKLCEFQTGIKTWETVFKELGNCLVTLKEGVYWMPKFIKFQYPKFPQSNVKQQESAISILANYGINIEDFNSYLTLSKESVDSYVNDNVNTINNSCFSFSDFWDLYPHKVAKSKCEPKYNKLTEAERQKIKDTLPKFLKYKPFESYVHPNPEAYLNQKRWEDVIPDAKSKQTEQKVIIC